MERHPSNGPTDAELEILQVLWDLGPSTVRVVFDRLGKLRRVGYTTVLKQMQLMLQKDLLTRDEEVYPHTYRPRPTRRRVQGDLVRNIAKRGFQGSFGRLALHALSAEKATPEELAEVQALLDQLKGHSK